MATVTQASVSQAASKPNMLCGFRHIQVGMICMAMFVSHSLTFMISVTIVAMVDNQYANPDFPQYNWNEQQQSLILSGFTWGLVVFQTPSGILSDRYGSTFMIGMTIFFTSLLSVLTPLAAPGGWGVMFTIRLMQGLSQGIFRPAMQTHLSKWVPAGERGFLIALPFAFGQLGNMITLAVSGVMSTGAGGWPSVFYLFGGLGVAWTVLWMLLASNTPSEERHISTEERAYIEDSIGTNVKGAKPLKTPWTAMMTSLPLWALIVANCGRSWGFWTLNTEAPTFMKTVLGFDLKSNGLLTALLHFWSFLLCIVLSRLSDFLNNRKITSVLFSRKLFNTIGLWVPATALFSLALSPNVIFSVVMLNISIGANAACYVGFKVNHLDIAPNYAGTLNGITNTIASLFGCFAPIVVGAIVTQSGSVAQWQIVFFIASGIYFTSGLVFLLFGKASLQTWNDPPTSETTPLLLAKDKIVL